MNYILTLILSFGLIPAFAQFSQKFSLKNQVLTIPRQQYKLEELVDGRERKESIGLVQTGVLNKKKFAVFEKSLEEEFSVVLKNSDVFLQEGDPITIRITKLNVDEITSFSKETGRAELVADFFLKSGEEYIYLNSFHGSSETISLDVTLYHPNLIVKSLESVLIQFSTFLAKDSLQSSVGFSSAELNSGVQVEIDPSTIEILNVMEYKDGIYLNFQEFLNNNPSITSGYEIADDNKVKVWQTDDSVRENRLKKGMYAICSKNELYILFHRDFYHLEREENTFTFEGPVLVDSRKTNQAYFIGGLFAAYITAATTSSSKKYKIDMRNGSFVMAGY